MRHALRNYDKNMQIYLQNFDSIPHVVPGKEQYYGGSVSLADYCPYIQEFTWRAKNIVVRGSHCLYEENNPRKLFSSRFPRWIIFQRCGKILWKFYREFFSRSREEFRSRKIRSSLEVLRSYESNVGGKDVQTGQTMATLGLRMLSVQMRSWQTSHNGQQNAKLCGLMQTIMIILFFKDKN